MQMLCREVNIIIMPEMKLLVVDVNIFYYNCKIIAHMTQRMQYSQNMTAMQKKVN